MATATPQQPNQARPWNPDFQHTDRERWICIYPAYLNSRKTLKEGRKIPKGKAIDNPLIAEIRDCVATAGFVLGVENKTYPRELEPRDMKYRGRVRVMIKNEDGSPTVPQLPTRQSVLLYVATMIPKLKARQQSHSGAHSQQQQQQQQSKNQKKKGRK